MKRSVSAMLRQSPSKMSPIESRSETAEGVRISYLHGRPALRNKGDWYVDPFEQSHDFANNSSGPEIATCF